MIRLTVALITIAFATSIHAADKPGKAAFCEACHGANGASPIMDTYPKLNGQNKGYLISALKDYKAGKRTGAFSAVMSSQASSLTDEEMEMLAAYFSAQK